MEFTVPQFIEKEAKIVGPLTFKQFIYVGTAGGICIFLYFTVSFGLFIFLTIIFMGGALALAFVKIGKDTLPVFIKNLFVFAFKPRVYLWHKKTFQPITQKKVKIKSIEKEEQESSQARLKISKESQLSKLLTNLETKNK